MTQVVESDPSYAVGVGEAPEHFPEPSWAYWGAFCAGEYPSSWFVVALVLLTGSVVEECCEYSSAKVEFSCTRCGLGWVGGQLGARRAVFVEDSYFSAYSSDVEGSVFEVKI